MKAYIFNNFLDQQLFFLKQGNDLRLLSPLHTVIAFGYSVFTFSVKKKIVKQQVACQRKKAAEAAF